jgi:hypothetical protein
MAGPSLSAPSPIPSTLAHAATHRNILSGLLFRKSGADPRQHALLLAPDGWRATGWLNRDLDRHPFEAIDARADDADEGDFSPTPTPVVTRTRRTFAAIPIANGEVLSIQASRRARECTGVQLLHGIDGEPDRIAHLLLQPATARMLARALIEAAAAVDQAQRNPLLTRAEVRHG